MKRDYTVEATKELNELLSVIQEIKVTCNTDEEYFSFRDWVYKNEEELREYGINYSTGVTRTVLWFDEREDFVFKFDETDSVYGLDEVDFYYKASDLDIAEAFAWCDWIGTFKFLNVEYNITAMEFCAIDSDGLSSESYEYHYNEFLRSSGMEDTDEAREDFDMNEAGEWMDETEGMLDLANSKWSDDLYEDVVAFLDWFGINDLHSGNWGYTMSGNLVLTDYAGYNRFDNSRYAF